MKKVGAGVIALILISVLSVSLASAFWPFDWINAKISGQVTSTSSSDSEPSVLECVENRENRGVMAEAWMVSLKDGARLYKVEGLGGGTLMSQCGGTKLGFADDLNYQKKRYRIKTQTTQSERKIEYYAGLKEAYCNIVTGAGRSVPDLKDARVCGDNQACKVISQDGKQVLPAWCTSLTCKALDLTTAEIRDGEGVLYEKKSSPIKCTGRRVAPSYSQAVSNYPDKGGLLTSSDLNTVEPVIRTNNPGYKYEVIYWEGFDTETYTGGAGCHIYTYASGITQVDTTTLINQPILEEIKSKLPSLDDYTNVERRCDFYNWACVQDGVNAKCVRPCVVGAKDELSGGCEAGEKCVVSKLAKDNNLPGGICMPASTQPNPVKTAPVVGADPSRGK